MPSSLPLSASPIKRSEAVPSSATSLSSPSCSAPLAEPTSEVQLPPSLVLSALFTKPELPAVDPLPLELSCTKVRSQAAFPPSTPHTTSSPSQPPSCVELDELVKLGHGCHAAGTGLRLPCPESPKWNPLALLCLPVPSGSRTVAGAAAGLNSCGSTMALRQRRRTQPAAAGHPLFLARVGLVPSELKSRMLGCPAQRQHSRPHTSSPRTC